MGWARIGAITVAAAVFGGLAAVLIGRATNTLGGTKTVVVETGAAARPAAAPLAVRGSLKPLLGNGFDPARIYAARGAA